MWMPDNRRKGSIANSYVAKASREEGNLVLQCYTLASFFCGLYQLPLYY
jgi:hypothetical protein